MVHVQHLLAVILIALGQIAPAAAAVLGEVRTFAAPAVNGVRLDWCKHWGRDCGQPAADLFCQQQGFDKATRFAIEPNVGARGVATVVFGDGRQCHGPQCNGFRAITCLKDKPTVTAQQPAVPVPPTTQPTPQRPNVPPLVQPRMPPGLPLSSGASLYRCSGGGCDQKVTTDFELDAGSKNQVKLFGFIIPVNAMPHATAILWQVADRPFPVFRSGAASDFSPPGLLDSGRLSLAKLPTKEGGFNVDFLPMVFKLGLAELAKTGKVTNKYTFYVRVLPLAQINADVLAGQPTNVIRALYGGHLPPQAPYHLYIPVDRVGYYDLAIESFTLADFPDPNRWGCVIITDNAAASEDDRKDYPVNAEVCPKNYTGAGYQIDSLAGFIEMLGGGWDWIADKYDKLKEIAVDIVTKYSPFGVGCQFATKMFTSATNVDAGSACRAVADIAVNAGMAAVGLPPSLPNYNELVDKGVDYGVELAATQIYESTGVPCDDECKKALRDGLQNAASGLKNSAGQQACSGDDEAHKHGREQLCLPAGVLAKPAPRATYRPPTVTIKLTRRPGMPNPDRTCAVTVSMLIKNRFPGGLVSGPHHSGSGQTSKKVNPQNVEGKLYVDVSLPLPNVKAGTPLVTTLTFDRAEKFTFWWTKELWVQSQTPPLDFIAGDWMTLYSGGTANLLAQSKCTAKNASFTRILQTVP